MPKIKVKIDKEPVSVAEVTETAPVESPAPVEKKSVWPETKIRGRFHTVEFGGGYVVYNPAGQRATGVLRRELAEDVVRNNNYAAQIK